MESRSLRPLMYFGMESMGPGRYNEIPSMMSSRLLGLSSFIRFFIPALSS